ncbi:uncharacterized protein ACR2FA_009432 [Aphomia sociella]
MEANDFLAKLKADGTERDLCDLNKVYNDYKLILRNINTKDRGPFSLNVLCLLCRNLDKVPTWRDRIENKLLLTLSIDCVRETRALDRSGCVKTLACIYHIHKHVVKNKSPLPPELVLKISFMAFECDTDNLLTEYCKTYWSILVYRMTYIELLKSGRVPIIKLLPKLTEDILKVIHIYDTSQYCINILVFLFKKLHFLYSDSNPNELNATYGQIFEKISKKSDLGSFKKLKHNESLELYVKLNGCIHVIVENSMKIDFKDAILNGVVRTCVSLLGHNPDMFHCLQTFYSNSFCSMFTNCTSNSTYLESIINSLLMSCETTEKLGYVKTMYATYPYLNQLLRLYIEYLQNNDKIKWDDHFTEQSRICCLKFVLLLMRKSRKTNQLVKCEKCNVKSGIHDALHLSFLTKHFITSVERGINITNILPIYNMLITEQHSILNELCSLNCYNYEKCYRKLQTDIHNTAILLNKTKYYENSIKLFTRYLKHEIKYFKNEIELKNISRGFYNKSICELDCKMYDHALRSAFLSLVFAQSDGLSSDKYMSLVIDIKAKALKNTDEDEDSQDELQLMSVLEACKMCVESEDYGNLRPFLTPLKFSQLLKHEFSVYAKLWPSVIPIAGVWRSLNDLVKRQHPSWVTEENEDVLKWTLYEVIMETPTVVRTIHSEYYTEIITELVEKFEKSTPQTTPHKIANATMLYLKTEYDLAAASQKYGWKITEPSMDPDLIQSVRTLSQEHEAVQYALRAVDLWTDIQPMLHTVESAPYLSHALQTAQVCTMQLLQLHWPAAALQLALHNCALAEIVADRPAYLRNAGLLISHMDKPSKQISEIIATASKYCSHLLKEQKTLDTALVFVCDAAIHYAKCGKVSMSARLVRHAQASVLTAYEMYNDINLDFALGRLLEAQWWLRGSPPSELTSSGAPQRHYLAISSTGATWSARRSSGLASRERATSGALLAARRRSALAGIRRARCTAAACLPAAPAVAAALLHAAVIDVHRTDDAQTKIDNRLKYVLDLQPCNETSQPKTQAEIKQVHFTPKQNIETMLENMTFKKSQTSPSVPCISVPSFRTPEFLKHTSCRCAACENPYSLIITCLTAGLEATTYFRAKESDIARNYYDGAFKCFGLAEAKLNEIFNRYRSRYDTFIADAVKRMLMGEFIRIYTETLIEASHFELSLRNYEKSDEYVIRIYETVQDLNKLDGYTHSDVMNLMVASAQLRKIVKKPAESGLEVEFEGLKLSPSKDAEPPKTPEAKPVQPPKITKLVVKDEEILKKRRVIKLNLDESDDKEHITTKKSTRREQFKIPVPITKHVLENITPRATRSKPALLLTQPSEETKTPLPDTTKLEFHTPESTPDQFFTPMTSIKTYSKQSLRNNIVKKLETEFATPKTDRAVSTLSSEKEKLELPKTRASRSKIEVGKKNLRRATSPGKLEVTGARRLRKPGTSLNSDNK